MDDLPPIKRRRLYQDVAERIQEVILGGTFRPGDRLPTERELAERYSVSRTVVREALKVLETRGLVTVRRGSGVVVNRPDTGLAAEILEIHIQMQGGQESLLYLHEVRHYLEGEIVELAAERRTDSDLHRLRSLLEQIRDPSLEPDALVQLDLRFHLALARATQNPVFGLILNLLMDLLREEFEISWHGYPEWPPTTVIAQHEAILEAIAAGDRRLARRMLVVHLTHSEQVLKAALAQRAKRTGPAGRHDGESPPQG